MICRKILFVFCILLLVFNVTVAQNSGPIPEDLKNSLNALQTTVPFLAIAPDSRGGAMGDLGAATSPDANSQTRNAARYAFIEHKMGVSVSYAPWLRTIVKDINLGYLSFYYRFNEKQAISVAMKYFSLGQVIFRDSYGQYSGQYTPYELSLDAGYARLFSERFSGALVLRYIRSDITGGGTIDGQQFYPGNSFAADLGIYYQRPFSIREINSEFAWGACFSNLGSKISYTEGSDKQFIPANLRLGARVTLHPDEYNSLSGAVDFSKLLVPTPPIYVVNSETGDSILYGKPIPTSLPMSWIQSFYDAPGGFDEEMREIMISAGLEYWYRKQFAIRGGYFHEHKLKGNRKHFAVGVGVKLNVFYLDFSYLISASGKTNPLANTMRFTLGLDISKK
ncbi:MAG: type IX secretion system outer membrane channel protein PorV [Bacteroidales bacterium]|nr:type IX secretion system outer membrane channel protein PorV [Bacteroidales bacterium]